MSCITEKRFKKIIQAVLLISFIALTVSVLVLSSVPPVSRDALTHHLVVPKLYLEHGGMVEIPSIKYSYYPMNLDLLYLVPLFFGNDIIPKYIHFAFALFTALFVYHYLKKRIGSLYGWMGALFFLSIPMIVKLSITVYVDLGLIFFSFASLLYLLEWCSSKNLQFKYLFFAALYCGLALGTKYNALILLTLISLFIPVVYSRSVPIGSAGIATAVGYSSLFVFIALLLYSPWMIRNYIWKKNPIYPMYHQFFSSAKVAKGEDRREGDQKAIVNKKFGSFALRHIVYQESWWQTASIPIRIFFQGEDDNPKFFDGKLNPFLLLLPVFAFWGYKVDQKPTVVLEKNVMLGFSVLFLLFAFVAQDIRIRYISPIIPPLVVLSIFGLHGLIEKARQGKSTIKKCILYFVAGGIICGMFWLNIRYIVDQFRHVAPMTYLTGQVDREQYIEKYRPDYAVIQFGNQNLPLNARVLSIFLGNRYYYSDRKMVFSLSMFTNAVKKSTTPEEIVSELKKHGITHIMIGFGLFNTWATGNFNEQEKIMIDLLFNKRAVSLFSKNGYGLFQLQ